MIFGLDFQINNPSGYIAFFSLLFLIIIYFMKPKPVKKIVPSIIFLEKESNRKNFFLFFKKFIKDWLFLLQLLILIILCFAVLDITTEIFKKKLNENVVLVIDASASSQTKINNKMFLDFYKEQAKKNLGINNYIILAKNQPEVIAKETNFFVANSIINNLKPTESLSNIFDSIILASNLIKKGKIIVFSDFIDSNAKDVEIAKKIAEAKGLEVYFIKPNIDDTTNIENIGIIDYKLEGNKLTIEIKNFNNLEKTFKINYNDKFLDELTIKPFSVMDYNINLESEKNYIKLDVDDDLQVDNNLYILINKKSENSLLYITNSKKNNLKSAFESMSFLDLKIEEPPILKIENQKIIILNEVNYDSILPGTIEKIKESLEKGNTLIISAQEDYEKLNEILYELMPVEIEKTENEETIINNNYINHNINGIKDIDFGTTNKFFISKLKDNNSIVLAETNDKYKSPLIVLKKYGKGNILFYGILDKYSNFKNTPQYILFWLNILKILDTKNIKLNYKISEIVYGNKIILPNKETKKDFIMLEKTGFYNIDGNEISANLLNDYESNIYLLNKLKKNESRNDYNKNENNQKTKQTINLIYFFIPLIILLSFLEIYIIKRRGDI
ncbi:MAG: VWA domain-containing protein [Candidatus Woesearchaeota archaeon]